MAISATHDEFSRQMLDRTGLSFSHGHKCSFGSHLPWLTVKQKRAECSAVLVKVQRYSGLPL
jgi:hypothetical protein